MLPASFAAEVPVFIATPTSACASAGASFVPSPVIATMRPFACSSLINAIFVSGVASARKSSTPASWAITAAVTRLSPVIITVRIPIRRSSSKRSFIPPLTTFSIANDVAKYFAILPAMFAFTYAAKPGERGPLNSLNIMHLGTPQSAIISAIIFNALIIPALVPLALKGVKYRAIGATALLRRNLLIYGLGGVILPFIGIKLIDLIVHNLLGA